jgi:hexokinase
MCIEPFFRQERIDHGKLIRWTKGFGAKNTEGRDVAAMFRQSLQTYVRKPLSSVHFY